MEEDIKHYSQTVMFRGTPHIFYYLNISNEINSIHGPFISFKFRLIFIRNIKNFDI